MATPTNLPTSFTAGNVLTAAQMNNLRGAFRVLQVVYGSTSTQTESTTTTYADTSLSASITCQATSSKVLVTVHQTGIFKSDGNASNAVNLKLFRGATELALFGYAIGYNGVAAELYPGASSISYLDSPSSTSSLTYKTQFANLVAASLVRVQQGNALSTIVLMEISA